MKEIAGFNEGNEEERAGELNALLEEAHMPIEDILANIQVCHVLALYLHLQSYTFQLFARSYITPTKLALFLPNLRNMINGILYNASFSFICQ